VTTSCSLPCACSVWVAVEGRQALSDLSLPKPSLCTDTHTDRIYGVKKVKGVRKFVTETRLRATSKRVPRSSQPGR